MQPFAERCRNACLRQAPDQVVPGRSIVDHLDLELRNLTRTLEEPRSDRLPEAAEILSSAPPFGSWALAPKMELHTWERHCFRGCAMMLIFWMSWLPGFHNKINAPIASLESTLSPIAIHHRKRGFHVHHHPDCPPRHA